MTTEYRKNAHSVFLCDYHFVFCTKYRRAVINAGLGSYLKQRAYELTEHYPTIVIKAINTDRDHIHLLVSLPPTMSPGSFVRLYKTNSSHNIKKQFEFLQKVYYRTDSLWSSGYFVSTVGINQETIQNYIRHQGKEDLGQTATLFEM